MKKKELATIGMAIVVALGLGVGYLLHNRFSEKENYLEDDFDVTMAARLTYDTANIIISSEEDIISKNVEEHGVNVSEVTSITISNESDLGTNDVITALNKVDVVENAETVSSVSDEISKTEDVVITTSIVEETNQSESVCETVTISEIEETTENMYTSTEDLEIENLQEIIDNISAQIEKEKEYYPRIVIGVGVYNYPDFRPIYEYNATSEISAGCTVKAAYALFVLKECEKRNIDIYSTYLKYNKSVHYNDGSGDIKYYSDGSTYTIETLITKLLGISDNTAYNILLGEFKLNDFQTFLNGINGQNLYGCRYGIASVIQRKNEWRTLLEYCSSNAEYSDFLRNAVSNTEYCYIAQGLSEYYPYMHKSGWADGSTYTCAADCAIVMNTAIFIITSDYSSGEGHVDSVRRIAGAIEPLI